MAFDAFLKITGITGESTDTNHEGWIEVLSFSWGASNSVNASARGASAGKAAATDFSFLKQTDSASPQIFLKLCEGYEFSQVSLACRKSAASAAGEPESDFLKIEFYNVLFTGITEGGNTATDQQPAETISFAFQKVVFAETATTAAGGAGATITGTFNFTTNTGVAATTPG